MTATAAQIAQVRRMVNEPTTDTYTDTLVQGFIEAYPLVDAMGQPPTVISYTTTPPSYVENENWAPTYDLNAAAADIWDEKASALSCKIDYSADGSAFHANQEFQNALRQACRYRSRRSPRTITLRPEPIDTEDLTTL